MNEPGLEKNTKKQNRLERCLALTGASGFIGARLLKTLESDATYTRIVAIDYRRPHITSNRIKYYKLDLTETLADVKLYDILKKESPETFVHTAFPMTPPHNEGLAHEIISIGTMYVLNALSQSEVKKLVVASTADVYGAFPSNPNYLTEDHHPKGDRQSRFLADKIDAEKQVMGFAKKFLNRIVTILRPCTILGPTIESYKTRYLRRPIVTTVLGFDPLLQFIHEDDVTDVFVLAIKKDVPGIFNLTGDGVLPLSRVIQICGKTNLRLTQIGLKTAVQMMWYADLSPAPASHVDFLRYLCVVDAAKAKHTMAFKPRFSTKETLLSFVGAERLREINLLEVGA